MLSEFSNSRKTLSPKCYMNVIYARKPLLQYFQGAGGILLGAGDCMSWNAELLSKGRLRSGSPRILLISHHQNIDCVVNSSAVHFQGFPKGAPGKSRLLF